MNMAKFAFITIVAMSKTVASLKCYTGTAGASLVVTDCPSTTNACQTLDSTTSLTTFACVTTNYTTMGCSSASSDTAEATICLCNTDLCNTGDVSQVYGNLRCYIGIGEAIINTPCLAGQKYCRKIDYYRTIGIPVTYSCSSETPVNLGCSHDTHGTVCYCHTNLCNGAEMRVGMGMGTFLVYMGIMVLMDMVG